MKYGTFKERERSASEVDRYLSAVMHVWLLYYWRAAAEDTLGRAFNTWTCTVSSSDGSRSTSHGLEIKVILGLSGVASSI